MTVAALNSDFVFAQLQHEPMLWIFAGAVVLLCVPGGSVGAATAAHDPKVQGDPFSLIPCCVCEHSQRSLLFFLLPFACFMTRAFKPLLSCNPMRWLLFGML